MAWLVSQRERIEETHSSSSLAVRPGDGVSALAAASADTPSAHGERRGGASASHQARHGASACACSSPFGMSPFPRGQPIKDFLARRLQEPTSGATAGLRTEAAPSRGTVDRSQARRAAQFATSRSFSSRLARRCGHEHLCRKRHGLQARVAGCGHPDCPARTGQSGRRRLTHQ